MGEPRVMAFDLGSKDYTVHTKSTMNAAGQWVMVQMIRIRDGKSGWREIEVKETSK